MGRTMAPGRTRRLGSLDAVIGSRKGAIMAAFGFSAGLPFALLVGTLTAWLGEAKVNMATIGVFAWIGLAFAFKFLWSPLVDRVRLPGLERLGRRRSWIVLCQVALAACYLLLAAVDPGAATGQFAAIAFAGALAEATQDIAIDAWRIEVADERHPVEVLSAVYQLGFRSASIVGGAFALFLAARLPWPSVFMLMAGLQALLIGATLAAPDTPRPPMPVAAARQDAPGVARRRAIALAVVALCWGWAIVTVLRFMVAVLFADPAATDRPSAAVFMAHQAPWVVVATVLVPLAVAAAVNRLARDDGRDSPARTAADHAYRALIAPLAELVGRLGWGVLLVIALILTYSVTYNVWAPFAYPFYLDFLHYSKDEVAFASKVFGIGATIAGVGLGAYLFARIGRFPTVLIGATLPILGNFLYLDLATGGARLDAVADALRLDRLAGWLGSDERMVRLLIAIGLENVTLGIAGAAFTAYVSGIVSKRFAAVQYALLASLTFLIGSLGRAVTGEAIDRYGYPSVFGWVAAAGLPAIGFVVAEWWRSSRAPAAAKAGHTGEPA